MTDADLAERPYLLRVEPAVTPPPYRPPPPPEPEPDPVPSARIEVHGDGKRPCVVVVVKIPLAAGDVAARAKAWSAAADELLSPPPPLAGEPILASLRAATRAAEAELKDAQDCLAGYTEKWKAAASAGEALGPIEAEAAEAGERIGQLQKRLQALGEHEKGQRQQSRVEDRETAERARDKVVADRRAELLAIAAELARCVEPHLDRLAIHQTALGRAKTR